jgi:hypothetical protein
LFVRFQQPFTAGLHRLNHLWIYVSRGTGYWGIPNRFGAPSEITRLRLVPMDLVRSARCSNPIRTRSAQTIRLTRTVASTSSPATANFREAPLGHS